MELTLNPPIVATFPWDAHLTAILNDGDEEKLKWIYGNYIQLTGYLEKKCESIYINYFKSSLWQNCPHISISKIGMDFYSGMSLEDKIKFIKHSINCGYYVVLQVYKNKIKAYEQSDFIDHQMMIYGYDEEAKILNIADFFSGKYRKRCCTYNELNEAWNLSLENIEKIDHLHLYLLKSKKIVPFDRREENTTCVYSFDLMVICAFLQDYLSGSNSLFRYRIEESSDAFHSL